MEIAITLITGLSVASLILYLLQFWRISTLKSFAAKRRTRKLNRQLIDALTTMSNCLKAGLSLVQAIEAVEKEMEPPISEEFGIVVREHRMGVSLEETLKHLAARMRGDDIRLLATSITIAHELGANLVEIFENTATTIRERNRIQSRIETLTAQGRLQGIVVSALPVGLGLVLYLLSPEMIGLLFNTQLGQLMLALFVVLELCGWTSIKRIVTVNV